MQDRARLAVDHVHLEIKNDIETHSDGGQLTSIGNEAVKLTVAVNIHNRSHPKEIMMWRGTNRRYLSRSWYGMTRAYIHVCSIIKFTSSIVSATVILKFQSSVQSPVLYGFQMRPVGAKTMG
jgi:hypothetical protein